MLRAILALLASTVALVVATPLLLIGVPLWITAILTRRLARVLDPRSVHRWSFYDFDPVLGWRPQANADLHCLTTEGDLFHFVTGQDGWAGRGSVEESDVVVLGDSHAFGYGIDAERSYARILKTPRIKPLGAPGYNTVQELLVLREAAAKLEGKLVVWLLYPGNDMADNLNPGMAGYRTPFVRSMAAGWEIVTSHLSPEKWMASKGRIGDHLPMLAAIHAPTAFASRAYDASAFLLREGVELCRSVGARVIVVTMPSPVVLDERSLAGLRGAAPDPAAVDADFPDRQIATICAKLGVRFVGLKSVLTRSHFKADDDHLTAEGHRILAGLIARLYREEA